MIEVDTLPRAPQAERNVVGSVLLVPEIYPEVAAVGVRPEHFHEPAERTTFEVMRDLYVAGLPIEHAMLLDKLRESHEFFNSNPAAYLLEVVQQVDSAAHATLYAKQILDNQQRRDRLLQLATWDRHYRNGQATEDTDKDLFATVNDWLREREATAARDTFSLRDLCRQNPHLHPPVIEGLLREGETCNIIADSKVGKSWLAYGLAWSMITGQHWLGRFATARGRVLLIDNELHRSTLAHRIPAVAKAMGIDPDQYGEEFVIRPMRGRLASLADIAADLEAIEPHTYSMIIMDAKYRFIAAGTSESENGAETQFYNIIDQIAEHTRSAIVLIHHASKGDQSGKKITDVGSGAGAQSRAADLHLVIRPHEEDNVAVIEAAVRSFKPVEPLAIAWQFPLWVPTFGVDPGKLRGRGTRSEERQTDKDREGCEATLTALADGPASARSLRRKTGFGEYRQERLLDLLVSQGSVVFEEKKNGSVNHHEYRLAD